MATVRLLVLFLYLQIVSAQNPRDFKVSHVCRVLRDDNWQMELTVDTHGNRVDRIEGVNVDTVVSEGLACDATPMIAVVNPVQEIINIGNLYRLTANINSNTGVATPACGYQTTPQGGLAQGQFKWMFLVETDFFDPAIQFAYEKTYVLNCDFNDPTGTNLEFIDVASTLTEPPPPEVVDIPQDAKLDVVMSDTLSPINTVTSGTMTRLKASLITEGVTPQTPPRTGISPFSCKACSDSSCAGSVIQLTDENGCVSVDANGDPITILTEAFTNTLPPSDPNGAVLYTGAFEIFAFSQSLNAPASDVIFTCRFSYCDSDTGPAQCIDRCTHAMVRKKREANNHDLIKERRTRQAKDETNKNNLLYVWIKVIKDSIRSSSNPVTGEFQKTSSPVTQHVQKNTTIDVDDNKCSGFTGFVVGASVLGFTLLVGATACVCLCMQLSRRQRRSEKEIAADKTNPNDY